MLLAIDAVDQLLAKLVAEFAAGETQRPQRTLLARQLFTLHKAVQRRHATGDLRVINAVVQLRHDI